MAAVMWVSGALGVIFGSVALIPIVAGTYTLPTVNLIELAIIGIATLTIGIIEIVVGILVFTVNISAYTPTVAVESLSLVIGIVDILLALLFALYNPPLNPLSADFATLVAIVGAITYGFFTIFVSVLSFVVLNSRTARVIFNRLRPRDFGITGTQMQFTGGYPGQFGPFPGQFTFREQINPNAAMGGFPFQFGFPGAFGPGFRGQFPYDPRFFS